MKTLIPLFTLVAFVLAGAGSTPEKSSRIQAIL